MSSYLVIILIESSDSILSSLSNLDDVVVLFFLNQYAITEITNPSYYAVYSKLI